MEIKPKDMEYVKPGPVNVRNKKERRVLQRQNGGKKRKFAETGDYLVENIEKKRIRGGRTEYYVKWLGYPPWEILIKRKFMKGVNLDAVASAFIMQEWKHLGAGEKSRKSQMDDW